MRRGGTLVIVKATDDMANRAHDIMQRAGAADIDKRGAEWHASGWTRFDENAEPYTGVTSADQEWRESSKVGTVGGVAGAATGAAIGSVAGRVGTVVGGVAGAAAGAGGETGSGSP